MTEKEKFLNYVKGEVDKGLLDLKVTFNTAKEYGKGLEDKEEEIFAELNRMVEAPTLEDPEMF